MRELAGVLLKDVPRYVRALSRRDSADYLRLCNRREILEPAPDDSGFRCDWKWASDLHAPKHLPLLGRWLAIRALADHPIEFAVQPAAGSEASPEISFIIGHRGTTRLPHLLSTLSTIAAQRDVRVECLVVEQEIDSVLGQHLPVWVRHIHTPPPDAHMPYCRSWAFNVGARHARGRVFVLQDNDMLVPLDYASRMLSHFDAGFDVINLKRYVFYLNEAHTLKVLAGKADLTDEAPLAITQNLEGGGTVGITREGYERIGGMDESFIGWGCEDNEFWDRALTLKVWPYGYLPIVHLWHLAQPDKLQANSLAQKLYQAALQITPEERIQRLCRLSQGLPNAPASMADPNGTPS